MVHALHVHQIYYDDETRRLVDPRFTALDNTRNERPDWFEFWVIRNYLKSQGLDDEAWYGFLSPRFVKKLGLDPAQVIGMLEQSAPHADVALMSPHWDQIAYFLNPFEQGEFWHHGLMSLSQRFFDEIGEPIDLRTLISTSRSTAFSNYVIAKPVFWRRWLALADRFFDYVERGTSATAVALRQTTNYGSSARRLPMKTFIQERFVAVLLAQANYRVVALDMSSIVPPFAHLFQNDPNSRRRLQACDVLKQHVVASGDHEFLNVYWKLRAAIPTVMPVPAVPGA